MRALAALAIAGAFAACSKPNVRSCSMSPAGAQPTCIELQRAPSDAVDREQAGCATQHGVWSEGLCSRKDVVGGCMKRVVSQQFGAYTQVTWYYVSSTGLRTPPDVLASCTSEGGVALAP